VNLLTPSKLDVDAAQDVGISRRQVQEDKVHKEQLTTAGGLELTVGLVVDGEDEEGERAAKIATARILRTLKDGKETDVYRLLQAAFQEAHRGLRQEVEAEGGPAAMTASATLVAIHQQQLYLAHIGNSRAYLVRGPNVTQMTRDHMEGSGRRLNKALGLPSKVEPDLGASEGTAGQNGRAIPLRAGDRVVLCSDGLVKERPDGKGLLLDPQTEMAAVVNDPNSPALEAARTLVSKAVGRKADDNVSALVIAMPRPLLSQRMMLALVGAVVGLLLLCLVVPPLLRGGGQEATSTSTAVALAAEATLTPVPTLDPFAADTGRANTGVSIGTVMVLPYGSDSPQPLGSAESVLPGATVSTDSNGSIYLIIPKAGRVYLGSNTELYFNQIDIGDGQPTILTVQQGTIVLQQDGSATQELLAKLPDGSQTGLRGGAGTLTIRAVGGQPQAGCFSGDCLPATFVQYAPDIEENLINITNDLCPTCIQATSSPD
jgi:serine/threonine protein phosphatase PrpC